jgi:predicted small metal-binding protein
MKVLLSCTECDFEEWGTTERELMNKIVMWNHIKKAHIGMADRILRMYQTVPNNLYRMQQAR